jgi:CheY-like chemotaxis protein
MASRPALPNATPTDASENSEVRITATRALEPLTGMRILVVEDDPDALELLAMLLEQSGAEVATADTAAAAMAELDRSVPDVILCDITMPDQDGYEFIRAVRQRPRERGGAVPAAALTAHARAEDRRASLAAGFQGHLTKPVDPSDLARFLAAMARPGAAA